MTEQNKKTLIVVDDDQDIPRLLLCDALSQNGFKVKKKPENGPTKCGFNLEAESVDWCWWMYSTRRDGLNLLAQVRTQFTMPIMMLTGKGDEPIVF